MTNERNKTHKPAFIVAGVASGVGKTSVALGLTRALARRGLVVQPFKAGPDYLDPAHLTRAAGRPCYNLDGWMCGLAYCRSLVARTATTSDLLLLEGVMGLFDGVAADAPTGSTAALAAALDWPVLLVVDVSGMARSLAPLVAGFASFDPAVRIAGVFANRCGSDRHAALLAEVLDAANLPPLVGHACKDELPALPSRHLGLAAPGEEADAVLDALAERITDRMDLDGWLDRCRIDLPPLPASAPAATVSDNPVVLGVARDEAFSFYYPDNLECLAAQGARLVFFSPLHDTTLPGKLDGLYLGGGYPELHAQALSSNESMRASIRSFADSGRPVYGECGGLMYLSEALETLDGATWDMAGVLPARTRMLPRLQRLAMTEATFRADTLWGAAGTSLRGHEFHFSERIAGPDPARGWRPVYDLTTRTGSRKGEEGFQRGNVLCSYVHLHWAARPEAAAHFLRICREAR